ncbi:hypothetical protein BC940DRAFT_315778 [Gongronella butleri]|nr:hypothetical protein BC940DRAFT_315778 [Gongronella butleri]
MEQARNRLPPLGPNTQHLAVNLQYLGRCEVHVQRHALCGYIERFPFDACLWAMRARLEEENSPREVAIAIVRQGLEHLPGDWFLLATLERLQHEPEQAEEPQQHQGSRRQERRVQGQRAQGQRARGRR